MRSSQCSDLCRTGSTYFGCPWNRCTTIHEGYFYLCPLSTFWPEQFMRRSEKWKDISPTVDGLAIEGMTDERLQAFLNRQSSSGIVQDLLWSYGRFDTVASEYQ